MNEANNSVTLEEPSTTTKSLVDEDDLIMRFLKDVEARGLVGEKDNAATAFLCATSARLQNPLSLTVSGESSSGKNFLLGKVADFIPPEHKKFMTGMTPKVLMHAGENEFQHKAIFIAEYEGVAKADYPIRTMQSEKLIEWDYVDVSKGIKKMHHTVKGPAAFLQATTRPVLHPENETRLLFISVDESPEQTAAILQRQAETAEKGALPDDEQNIKNWHDFIKEPKTMNVSIPYAVELAAHFPNDRVRSRRDFPKLLGMIENLAFLHQCKRQRKDGAVVAAPEDYTLAKRLFESSCAAGPDSKLNELLRAAESFYAKGAFRISDLVEKTGWGKSKVYAVVQRAEELGCIAETDIRGSYRFIRNSAIPPLELPDRIM
jgi:hypothetical protein